MADLGLTSYGTAVNQDSLAAMLLTSSLATEGIKPLSAGEYWKHPQLASAPSAVLGESTEALREKHGYADEMACRISALLERAVAMAFEVDRLQQAGIHALTPFDEHYPCQFRARLNGKAPVVLYAAGSQDLLDRPGLGVVGSRDIDEEGAEVAKGAARLATQMGLPVVSGGARGVDQLAMNAAFGEHGDEGAVVGFLADSMQRKLKHPDTRRAIFEGRVLLCSPYEPEAHFTAGRAMGRNKLIYAGSLVTLVVASDRDSGGTWAGAKEALKHNFGKVAVWRGAGEGPGNAGLEELGATPVKSLEDFQALLIEDQDEPVSGDEHAPLDHVIQPQLPMGLGV